MIQDKVLGGRAYDMVSYFTNKLILNKINMNSSQNKRPIAKKIEQLERYYSKWNGLNYYHRAIQKKYNSTVKKTSKNEYAHALSIAQEKANELKSSYSNLIGRGFQENLVKRYLLQQINGRFPDAARLLRNICIFEDGNRRGFLSYSVASSGDFCPENLAETQFANYLKFFDDVVLVKETGVIRKYCIYVSGHASMLELSVDENKIKSAVILDAAGDLSGLIMDVIPKLIEHNFSVYLGMSTILSKREPYRGVAQYKHLQNDPHSCVSFAIFFLEQALTLETPLILNLQRSQTPELRLAIAATTKFFEEKPSYDRPPEYEDALRIIGWNYMCNGKRMIGNELKINFFDFKDLPKGFLLCAQSKRLLKYFEIDEKNVKFKDGKNITITAWEDSLRKIRPASLELGNYSDLETKWLLLEPNYFALLELFSHEERYAKKTIARQQLS